MFVALRDLRHARGRFVLMSVVIVLITFLVGFLAALTAGLARGSTSAIADLSADHLAFATPEGADEGSAPTFTESQVDAAAWSAWGDEPGVEAADPLGVAQARATAGGTTAAVTAFGVAAGTTLMPDGVPAPDQGAVVLSEGAAEALGAAPGDAVQMGRLTLTVAPAPAVDAEYSHTPVVWVSLADWQAVGAPGAADTGDAGQVATVVALTTEDGADLAAADARIGTRTLTTPASLDAIGSFPAENTSLTMMQAFLFAISALVVGAFFTVWTIQRSGDIAVLKALGATNRYLVRDALGQAAVVLVGGVGLGTALAAGSALLAGRVMPVVVDAATTLVPALVLTVLGLAGAALAVWRITRIDPHAALAAR